MMKKIYLLLFISFFSAKLFAQATLTGPYINFPDSNFLKALLNQQLPIIDINRDGKIDTSEANNTSYIDVESNNIFDLTGIEYFKNLDTLFCFSSNLIKFNLPKNTKLKFLHLKSNQLISLDVNKNINLEYLDCSSNKITHLDVSKNQKLKSLYCNNNELDSLNVSYNDSLKKLWCSNNHIKNLDVNKNILLTFLYCDNNYLTSINISKNKLINSFNCSYNNIMSLDLSNNDTLLGLWIHDMPLLKNVCVWTMPFPPQNTYGPFVLDDYNSPNIIYQLCNTSIEELTTNNISFYPNPATIELKVETHHNASVQSVRIFDIMGKEITDGLTRLGYKNIFL